MTDNTQEVSQLSQTQSSAFIDAVASDLVPFLIDAAHRYLPDFNINYEDELSDDLVRDSIIDLFKNQVFLAALAEGTVTAEKLSHIRIIARGLLRTRLIDLHRRNNPQMSEPFLESAAESRSDSAELIDGDIVEVPDQVSQQLDSKPHDPEFIDDVRRALESLSKRESEVLLFRVTGGLTTIEIANLLQLKPATVARFFRSAQRKMRDMVPSLRPGTLTPG